MDYCDRNTNYQASTIKLTFARMSVYVHNSYCFFLSSLCKWKRQIGLFVVIRYAVSNAKIRPYAVAGQGFDLRGGVDFDNGVWGCRELLKVLKVEVKGIFFRAGCAPPPHRSASATRYTGLK